MESQVKILDNSTLKQLKLNERITFPQKLAMLSPA